jgi:putative transferase (TIGR04331 family)
VAAVYDSLRELRSVDEDGQGEGFAPGYDLIECNRLMREDDDYRDAVAQDAQKVADGGQPVMGNTASELPKSVGSSWKQWLELLLAGRARDVILYLTPTVRADRLKLALSSWGRIGVKHFAEPTGIAPDSALRQMFSDTLKDQDLPADMLGRVIMRLLPKYLPILLLESLVDSICLVEKTLRKGRPRRIVSGYGFLTNVEFSVWAAECGRMGTEIWGWQHGGNYGECEPTFSERLERRLCDRFISWGWRDGGQDVVALPAPRQFLKNAERRQPNGRILWVTTADSRHVYYIDHLLFGPRFTHYFEHQACAFKAIPEELRKRVDVRLYPRDFGWGLRERWESLDPEVSIAPRGEPLSTLATRYDLVVIDHFGGTTLLECLLLDVPFVMIGQPCFFKIRESTRELFDAMCRQGVFYRETADFGAFLNQDIKTLAAWWREEPRRAAVNAYRQHLLKPSGTYIAKWRKTMLR